MEPDIISGKREAWVDWMRAAACFMVMVIHSTEPFYLGGDGSLILTRADAFWVSFFDSFVRASVPVFVVASSYLQFPLHYSTAEFFKRRVARIIPPFLFWTLVYALVWGEPVRNIYDLLLNFNYAAGHLWFIYMLLGIYLLMPLLSSWARTVGRRELGFYLILCLFTSFIPFIREHMAGDNVAFMFSTGGIPMQGLYPLWGEACWNEFGLFYYLSGFIGYILLGLYLRRFVGPLSTRRTLALAIPCFLLGFAISSGGFLRRVFASCDNVFPIGGDTTLAAGWETPWTYCTVSVAMMTIGWVLMFRLCNKDGLFYQRVLLPVSRASYGMYLCHMLLLSYFSSLFRGIMGIGENGVAGIWTTPVEIILCAVCTFVCAAAFSVLVQRIPKVGRWIIG